MGDPITGAVLAGGRSRRLGQDKALLISSDGLTLVEKATTKLKEFCQEVLVVVDNPNLADLLPTLETKIAADIYPHRGPLGGIYTGLLTATHPYCLVVACDMPFIKRELLSYMVEQPRTYDVLVPRINGQYEPLLAIYGKNALKPMAAMLEEGTMKVQDLLTRVKVRCLEEGEVGKLDPEYASFFNINRPQDLALAKAMGL